MLPVITTAEMRAADRATMDAGLGGFTLMETAGRGVAQVVLELLHATSNKSVVVVCGPGNNGGDGFVVGRVLLDQGIAANVYLAAPREKVSGHALQHLELFEKIGGRVTTMGHGLPSFAGVSVVVDALFGIGTTRPIEGFLASVVEAMNTVPTRVAIDVPSGVNTDTGTVAMTAANREGAFVRATHTVTVAAHKIGLVGSPGFAHAGEVSVIDIGIPASLLPRRTTASSAIAGGTKPQGPLDPPHANRPPTEPDIGAWLVEEPDVLAWLPIPQPLDHKGSRGHVLVISGAPEMRGAGRLASSAALASAADLASDTNAQTHATGREAHDGSGLGGVDPHVAAVSALRGGAGLVTLAGDGDVTASEAAVMTKSIGDDGLAPLLEKKTAVVIGPGLGTSDKALARVHEVLKTGKPCVIDADALNLLAKEGAEGMGKAGAVIITPHPAEAARLLGCTTDEIEADRMTAARALAKKTHAIVVLKGARTIICDGGEGNRGDVMRCFINPTGAPSLSTGGTGDVLAGLIGGLLAQGVFGVRAACCAAFLHGRAGELLYARYGRGALSSDLPRVIAELIGAETPRAKSSLVRNS
jgi:NAD(P)H-hydrate epimerase